MLNLTAICVKATGGDAEYYGLHYNNAGGEKVGRTLRTVTYNVADGRIPGAVKIGTTWFIPAAAQKPFDERRGNHRHPKKKEK
jgi:hypothetical protein